jgi:aminopeptidase N
VEADKATYNISVTVPDGLTAIATGLPVQESLLGQRKRSSFIMGEPISTTDAGVSIGRFTTTKARSSTGIPIRLYMAPNESPEIVEFTRKHLTGAIDYFSRILGTFPHPNCALIATGDDSLGDDVFAESNGSHIIVDKISDRLFTEEFGVHEGIAQISFAVASIWFGDAVAPKEQKDIWLLFGFTTYVKKLYQEQAKPGYNRALAIADYHAFIQELELEGQCLGPLNSAQLPFEWALLDGRGALTLYALEVKIGKAATLGILRSWVEKSRNRLVTTEEFVAHVSASTRDSEVTALLKHWIYDTYMPPFPVKAVAQ